MNKLGFDTSLEYEKHQRDYSVLGTTVVFKGLAYQNADYFRIKASPAYIVVKDDILYHFYANKDGYERVNSWLTFNTLETFKELDKKFEKKGKRIASIQEIHTRRLCCCPKKT